MGTITNEQSPSELLHIEKILKERMKNESTQVLDKGTPNGGSASMIPTHRYRFQQLKSYGSNSPNLEISTNGNNIPSSTKKKEYLLEKKSEQSPRQVKNRSIWCGGLFFCAPPKNKDHMKVPNKVKTPEDPLLSIQNIDESYQTYSSTKLLDEVSDENTSLSVKKENEQKLSIKIESKGHNNHDLTEIIGRLKEENFKLSEEYNALKNLFDVEEIKRKDQENHNYSVIIKDLEDQILLFNESIKKYKAEIEQQKQINVEVEEKLKTSTITEDLLLKKKKKDHEKVKELKAKHENEITELEEKMEMLKSTMEEQNSAYSISLQKLNVFFDSCNNYNNENSELHGDLEYTMNMIESFLGGFQHENESLKQESIENKQIIKNLQNEVQENSSIVEEMTKLVSGLSLEKLESLNSRWVLSFREKVQKLKDEENLPQAQSENEKNESNNVEIIDDKPADNNEEIKSVVSSVEATILEDISKQDNKDLAEDQASLTVASRLNDETSEKKTFELESVSVEKISKP